MTVPAIDESQRRAARVVGLTYLLALMTDTFAEFYVRSTLIVPGNAAATAHNIVASERLFRFGIAAELITFASDVVLIAALYVVLRPVNRSLALLAAFWRLVETSVMVVVIIGSFDVLRLLSGAPSLRAFDADRLQALAMLFLGAHGAGYQVGLFLFGLGSTVFAYLWFESRYIPRALAAWGVFSSLLVAASALIFVVWPDLAAALIPAVYAPIFIFELTMGLWLAIRGIRDRRVA